jgi:DNA-binding transcriptional LysR family regulator
MHLRYLKTFVAVASTLNITRAAERVHLAQSSVTEQIQALEIEVGAALFDRSRRRLALTEAGHRLLAYSTQLLALADEARAAVADAADATSGKLVIGGLETLCAGRLPPMLARFGQAYPAVQLQLKVAGSGDLRTAVKAGALDIAFAFGTPPADTELQHEEVCLEPLVVLASAGHRLTDAEAVSAADLVDENWLVTAQGCVYRQMFEDAFPPDGPKRPRVFGEFDSLAAIRALVGKGMGCALVPRLAVDHADPTVTSLPWEGSYRAVPTTMIWRRRRVQRPALDRFLTSTRAYFAAVTPADGRRPRAARSL